jgi:hypothetical protein
MTAVDAQVLDELQRDEVAIEIGVPDRAQHVQNGGFGNWIHKRQLSAFSSQP